MLTAYEKEMIIVALNMRKNYIQTGSVSLGPQDIANVTPEVAKREFGAELKILSDEQMRLCLATGGLIDKILHM